MKRHKIYPQIKQFMAGLEGDVANIPSNRKDALVALSDYIISSISESGYCKLTFICTHNSRRSHIAQVWAHAFSLYFDLEDMLSFSGGTEATAFHPNAIEALRKCGFRISDDGSKNNPRYRVQVGEKLPDLICFSKHLTEPPNPESDFCAIMVCSDADEGCPVVSGADKRISLPYDDPRHFDDTPEMRQKYGERIHEIGRDLMWCFDRVSERLSR